MSQIQVVGLNIEQLYRTYSASPHQPALVLALLPHHLPCGSAPSQSAVSQRQPPDGHSRRQPATIELLVFYKFSSSDNLVVFLTNLWSVIFFIYSSSWSRDFVKVKKKKNSQAYQSIKKLFCSVYYCLRLFDESANILLWTFFFFLRQTRTR